MLLPAPRSWRSSWILLLSISLILILFNSWLNHHGQSPSLVLNSRIVYETNRLNSDNISTGNRTSKATFAGPFYSVIAENRPQCDPLDHPDGSVLMLGFDASKKDQERADLLKISSKQKKKLTQAHTQFVKEIESVGHVLPYIKGSRGIVTTAGGPQLAIMVSSLRMLRESGSILPMEVFLGTDSDYDPIICEETLPSLNSTCIILEDIFKASNLEIELNRYQYKIVSILFSSFEEFLFLDSDAFPIINPDPLFNSQEFLSTGLILWPDFWFPSESKHYFDISGLSHPYSSSSSSSPWWWWLPSFKTIPKVSERQATESGEIMYSKSRHEKSLLLAAYYNYYGPEYYYPLLSQGAPGEGDKETFVWAAEVMQETYHFVTHPIRALGYVDGSGDWQGSAMVQYDPRSSTKDTKKAMFAHVNHPKFDPLTILDDSVGSTGLRSPTLDSDGTSRRAWDVGKPEETTGLSKEELGFDLEERYWGQILITACDGEHKFQNWKEDPKSSGICQRLGEFWRNVMIGDDKEKIQF